MRVVAEAAQVLITVKTTPMPSTTYGDTVCVAGVRIDGGRCEWIRLYPIAFRWLADAAKFKKYDIIDVEVRCRDADTRPESYSPTEDSIKVVRHLDGWKARQPVLQNLPRTTTCALSREARSRHDAPSLGMVAVAKIKRVWFEDHPGWSDKEQEKIAQAFDSTRVALFGDGKAMPPVLKAPALKFGYNYVCFEGGCKGHRGQLLDWELTELQRRLPGTVQEKRDGIRAKFETMMFDPKRESSFYMGNFEDPRKRANFSVLGVHYPERGIAEAATLF